MKTAQHYILILILLTMAGCSGLKLNLQDDLTYVNGLVSKEQYKLALHYIDRQNKQAPSYRQLQQQRPLILQKIKRYEQRTLTQSKELIKAQRWANSIELLEKAIDHIPDSKKLSRELNKQKIARKRMISQLHQKITLHEANSIKQGKALYQQLYKLDSSASITPEIIQERANSISRKLLNLAKEQVQNKETIKARNLLKLAGEVEPKTRQSSEFRGLLRKIETIEKEISKAISRNREIALEKQLQEFSHLFEQAELVAAQIVLKNIEKRFGKTKLIKELRKKLDDTVSREIAQHMANGKKFYSKEQIEQAINEWGHVLLLDPDSREALENISRAVKVLEKLHKVRKNRKK